jgi:hypothetical protein
MLPGHRLISDQAHRSAVSTGYTPSMYEWEVGWADIAMGFLGVACVRRTLRGQWMTSAVVVLAIAFVGDAIGHTMQWSADDNSAPVNVWAIPFALLQAGVAVVLLIIYGRLDGPSPSPRPGDIETAPPQDDYRV